MAFPAGAPDWQPDWLWRSSSLSCRRLPRPPRRTWPPGQRCPRPAVPAGARATGQLPGSTGVQGAVALKPRDPAGLAAYAATVTTPGSALYRRYLACRTVPALFGPAPATIAAVERHLDADGVRVTERVGQRAARQLQDTAADAQAAFGTRLERYQLADGASAFAPGTPRSTLPPNIAPAVQTVLGLDTTWRPMAEPLAGGRAGAGPSPPSTAATSVGPEACPAARADAAAFGGLTDQQIAHAYGVDGLYNAGEDGAGQTIAIYELEPFNSSDISTSTRATSVPPTHQRCETAHVVPVDGGQQVGYGSGESELDIDDVSAVAPGANIEVYEAPNTYYGLVDEFNAIVQDDTAKVATSSWASGCEAEVSRLRPGSSRSRTRSSNRPRSRARRCSSGPGTTARTAARSTGPVRSPRSCRRTWKAISPTSCRLAAPRSPIRPSPRPSRCGTTAQMGRRRRGHLPGLAGAILADRPRSVPGFDNGAIVQQRERRWRATTSAVPPSAGRFPT